VLAVGGSLLYCGGYVDVDGDKVAIEPWFGRLTQEGGRGLPC
jgi:hypothetical protein